MIVSYYNIILYYHLVHTYLSLKNLSKQELRESQDRDEDLPMNNSYNYRKWYLLKKFLYKAIFL